MAPVATGGLLRKATAASYSSSSGTGSSTSSSSSCTYWQRIILLFDWQRLSLSGSVSRMRGRAGAARAEPHTAAETPMFQFASVKKSVLIQYWHRRAATTM